MTALFFAVAAAAVLVCAALIALLKPLLVRYALARPNARSSHRVPTPQGGGIAVITAALATAGTGLAFAGMSAEGAAAFAMLALAMLTIGAVGVIDDIRPVPVLPRLVLQTLAVTLAVFAAGPDLRLFPEWLPLAGERALVILAGVWFVNLVNFMDGLDWMTVAEMVPVTGALSLLALGGALDAGAGLLAAGLLGGLLGFAPFNRPVARLFLGDVGSLPIGLLVGFLLYRLAGHGFIVAALLLPLYYLADATITLLRRLARGERVWQAHRSHFYQRATDNGFSVGEVVGEVFVLNLVLATLAGASVLWPTPPMGAALMALGAAAVGIVLARFARPRRRLRTAE